MRAAASPTDSPGLSDLSAMDRHVIANMDAKLGTTTFDVLAGGLIPRLATTNSVFDGGNAGNSDTVSPR